ncbi:MAG: hypothetical protein F9K48_06445 [Candidatus Brocadia sp.]|nr:MAG: hypothetical protein F9K48_06445 [Candidatus Brocadia sp.]
MTYFDEIGIVFFMPITKELENIRKFESVGFTHEQAEILAEALERSHVDAQQDLKEFINDKIDKGAIHFTGPTGSLMHPVVACEQALCMLTGQPL